jgi:hypothetical protein
MSLSSLPKEIRLQIWLLVYFAQSPRLVALRTKSHDEAHDETTFCPRYSPTPAPTAVNICHESRGEAYYQARKAGHVIRLHQGRLFNVASDTPGRFTEEFYFRFEIDILYLPLEDSRVKHFDDSPENGLLRHFRFSVDCDATLLRNIAVTQVIKSGYRDGSLSNTLQEFPHLARIVMIVPDDIEQNQAQKSVFVHAAHRIMTMYNFDMRKQSCDNAKIASVDVDFAKIVKDKLKVVPKEIWRDWSDLSVYNQWVEATATWGVDATFHNTSSFGLL